VTATIAGGNNTEDVKAINVRTADLRLFAAHYNNHLVGENHHLFRTLFCTKKPPNKPKIHTRTHNFVFPFSLSLSLLCTLHAHKHHQRDKHAREREKKSNTWKVRGVVY
jgi:hypothetical protein